MSFRDGAFKAEVTMIQSPSSFPESMLKGKDRYVYNVYVKVKYSSIAQSVEHAAVNRGVVGSSPTWGARKAR